MRTLPEWLAPATLDVSPSPPARGKAGGRLVRRTLGGLAALLAGPSAEGQAIGAPGFFHTMDPRAKVVGFLSLVVLTTCLATWRALAMDAALCVFLVSISRVSLRRLTGAWLAVPLFSVCLMLPAALNLVTPGEVVLPLWHPSQDRLGPWSLPPEVGVSASGLEAGARFVARSLLCVTFSLLLACTTRPDRLFRGLRGLGAPKVFVLLLTVMERYLWVLVRSAEEIHLAKLSRTLVPGGLRQEQAWVAAGAGALFRRSRSLGNAVYLAMVSRGFTGEARLLEERGWRVPDTGFVAASALSCALLLWLEMRP